MLLKGELNLAFNDQRRAFSDEFRNILLTSSVTHIEIASRNPMSSFDKVTIQELKNMPCILVSSEAERETEAEYYHTIIGLKSEKLFADNMQEARMLVISGKGFMPSEGTPIEGSGMGKSETDLKKCCHGAIIKKGLAIQGCSAYRCDAASKKWLEDLSY